MFGVQVSDQRRFLVAESMREKKHGTVPVDGPCDDEFRAIDFTGVEPEASRSRCCCGVTSGTGKEEECEKEKQGAPPSRRCHRVRLRAGFSS